VQSRVNGYQSKGNPPSGQFKAHTPITKSTLNTAEPTIVPKPTLDLATKVPMNAVANSGAEPPAAWKVAAATS